MQWLEQAYNWLPINGPVMIYLIVAIIALIALCCKRIYQIFQQLVQRIKQPVSLQETESHHSS